MPERRRLDRADERAPGIDDEGEQRVIPSDHLRPRSVVLLDLMVVGWLIVCAALGLAVAAEVRELAALSDSLARAGSAVEASGRALSSFGQLPSVGPDVAVAGAEIESAGRQAVASGRSTRETIESLSTLLMLAIAIIPGAPVVAVYLPWRLARRRADASEAPGRRRRG